MIKQYLNSLELEYWNKNTDFKNWTPWDILVHLQPIYDFMERKRIFTDKIINLVEIWEWNATSQSKSIESRVIDFCFVVTQVRNVADITLNIKGQITSICMSIAQCFARPPIDPSEPGTMAVKFRDNIK